ncbi:TonB-dependent siderophore receptor [Luteibacter aegosomatissinici]|uniref:TonB-dependent siderophore receptor n=1 Tax=Luteibacter aegosomatissinici TaxID=2911539 RepID=UPI001FF9A8F8|nr:TonB-dependent siderophore receptor [Luteibacter aegosomatissinici]UPG93007.1 TonB-dependent siderophore receptor [Luteibacter aegosomatissinici]
MDPRLSRRSLAPRISALCFALSLAFTHAAVAADNNADADPKKKRSNATELDKVAVEATTTDATSAGSKIDIPNLETAQAISVIPRQLIDDQGVRRLPDALRNVAGVSRSDVYGFFDGFNIRGFDASSGATYLDGLALTNEMASTELGGLERIEVVKGPASGLYGQGPLSGLVNLMSKRPRNDAFVDVRAAVGTDDFREIGVDANTPLSKDGQWLGRLNIIRREQDYFVDASDAKRTYIAPALTWAPTSDTTWTFLGTYQHDKLHPWSPTTAYGTILYNPNGRLPRDRAVNDTQFPAEQTRDAKAIGWQLDQRITDWLSFHQGVRYEDFHNSWDHWLFASGLHEDDMRTLDRFYYGPYNEHGHSLRVDNNVTITGSTGAIDHELLVGIDFARRMNSWTNNFDYGPYPFDVYAPQYGTVPGPVNLDITRSRGDTKQLGWYVQDHAVWGKWSATFGARIDKARTGTGEDTTHDTAISPRVGLTYAISDSAAWYANWSKSFNPQGGYPRWDGGTVPPERGRDIETGFKVQSTDGRLHGMVTAFQLTRQNVATEDLDHPNFYVVTGEQRSRGLELEGGIKPVAGLDITLAYAWTKAEITKDHTLPTGVRLAGIPRHNANLWAKYMVQGGALAGWGVGGGINYQSERLASNYEPVDPVYGRPFVMKAYTLFDAAVYYTHGPWDAQVNVRNVFDRKYFVTASSDRTAWGSPRSVMLEVERHF